MCACACVHVKTNNLRPKISRATGGIDKKLRRDTSPWCVVVNVNFVKKRGFVLGNEG